MQAWQCHQQSPCSRRCTLLKVCCKYWRYLTMSRSVTATLPITVDIAVVLTAIIRPEPEAGGYSASIPALPGCYTQGETLDEVRANLREADDGWLGGAPDDGLGRVSQ